MENIKVEKGTSKVANTQITQRENGKLGGFRRRWREMTQENFSHKR